MSLTEPGRRTSRPRVDRAYTAPGERRRHPPTTASKGGRHMKVSNRITRLVLVGLAVLALAAPAASAAPAPIDAQPAERVVIEPQAPVVQSVDDRLRLGVRRDRRRHRRRAHPARRLGRHDLPPPPRAHRRRELARTRHPRRPRAAAATPSFSVAAASASVTARVALRCAAWAVPSTRASTRWPPSSSRTPTRCWRSCRTTSPSSTRRRSTTTSSPATPTSSRSSSTRRRTRRRPRSCR